MSAPRVVVTGRLGAGDVSAVEALLHAATDADGVQPLSEHVWLHLRHGGEGPDRNLRLLAGGQLVGYAHLDPTDPVAGPSAEIVVHPAFRGHGYGRLLVQAALDAAPRRRLRLWSHGDHPAARALAESMGFSEVRRLEQWRRSLREPAAGRAAPARRAVADLPPGRGRRGLGRAQRRARSPGTPSRAAGPWRTCAPGWPRTGSIPPGSCSRSRTVRTAGRCWSASTGRRCTVAIGAPTATATVTSRSARCTSSGSTPRTRAAGLGRALTVAGLRLPAGSRPHRGHALRRERQRGRRGPSTASSASPAGTPTSCSCGGPGRRRAPGRAIHPATAPRRR